jgi:mono/diheme cytochrome c family protein
LKFTARADAGALRLVRLPDLHCPQNYGGKDWAMLVPRLPRADRPATVFSFRTRGFGASMRRQLVMSLLVSGFLASVASSAAAQGAAEKGAAVYAAQKCSTCHALDGKGMAKGPLDGIGGKLSAAEIHDWIVNPAEMSKKANATRKPAMKAYTTLPKEDLDALVAFLASKK